MEYALTIAQTGLGTAASVINRKAAKATDPKRKAKLLKAAAALRAANTAITELLSDPDIG